MAMLAKATTAAAQSENAMFSLPILLGGSPYLGSSNFAPNLFQERNRLLHLRRQKNHSAIRALLRRSNQTILLQYSEMVLYCLVVDPHSLRKLVSIKRPFSKNLQHLSPCRPTTSPTEKIPKQTLEILLTMDRRR